MWLSLAFAQASTLPAVPTPETPPATEPVPAEPVPAEPGPAEPGPAEAGPAEPAPAPIASGPAATNVLLVLLDDIGTDKISGYGEHPRSPQTPVIDSLARQGVRFKNAYSYALCSPTRAALLTGRYGRRNGYGVIVTWTGTWELPLDEVTLPELLDRSGRDWSTAVTGKWHLSAPRTANGSFHPNRQGFAYVAGSLNNLYFDDEDTKKRGDTDYYEWEKNVNGTVGRVHEYATRVTTNDAIAWVATAAEPWFLYVPYNAAHSPFQPPPGSSVPKDAPPPQRQGAMVEDVDREIGRLLAGLPPGQRERTLVIVLADNGTAHGAVTAPRSPSQAKGTLFEGGTNIPFVVSGPGVFRGGTTDALVHVVDVLPTIAEWTGVDVGLTRAPIDGVSFGDVLRDPSSAGKRRFVYTERFSPIGPPPYSKDERAVRDDRYKLILGPDGERFYDLLGRDDDGVARTPDVLQGDERVRYDALRAELERLARDVTFAY